MIRPLICALLMFPALFTLARGPKIQVRDATAAVTAPATPAPGAAPGESQPSVARTLTYVAAPLFFLAMLVALLFALMRSLRTPADKAPDPQPTESEAIVAALREPQTPTTPLMPPSPLPVDLAADTPPAKSQKPAAKGAAKKAPAPKRRG
jgi:hypothetical protein